MNGDDIYKRYKAPHIQRLLFISNSNSPPLTYTRLSLSLSLILFLSLYCFSILDSNSLGFLNQIRHGRYYSQFLDWSVFVSIRFLDSKRNDYADYLRFFGQINIQKSAAMVIRRANRRNILLKITIPTLVMVSSLWILNFAQSFDSIAWSLVVDISIHYFPCWVKLGL